MWEIFVKGGPVMYPLALLSILGVAVAIEKGITLRNKRVIQSEIVGCIESVKDYSDIPMAIKLCSRYNTPFANLIRAGLEEAAASPLELRQTIEDVGRREMKRLEKYLVVLETVAGASPLLGLI